MFLEIHFQKTTTKATRTTKRTKKQKQTKKKKIKVNVDLF